MTFRVQRQIGLVLVVVAASVGLVMGQRATPAYACTQPVGGHPQRTIEERTASAEVVAVGTVVHYVENGDQGWLDLAIVEVERYYVGGGPSVITVVGFGDSMVCLQMLAEGQRYVFWMRQDDNGQYRADYAGTLGAAFFAGDETLATLSAVAGDGVLPTDGGRNGGINADATIAQYTVELTASQVAFLGTYRPYALTETAVAAASVTPIPSLATANTTAAHDGADLGSLFTSAALCLSTLLGPMSVLLLRQRHPNQTVD